MKRTFSFFKKLFFHPDRRKRLFISLLYCGLGVYANFFLFQVFCLPVIQAVVSCLLFLAAVLVLPFVKNHWWRKLVYFFVGTGVPICLYCIWFLMDTWDVQHAIVYYFFVYLLLGLFFGIGLLAYIPVYLLYHIYRYFNVATMHERLAQIAGCVLPFVILLFYLDAFRKQYYLFKEAVTYNKVVNLPANYFTERLLGIGFKYHTQLEFVYDGWRPPLHDPFLNIGLWIYADSSYPFKKLNRIKYYRMLFPAIPLKVNCPCSYTTDGTTYLKVDWQKDLYYDKN